VDLSVFIRLSSREKTSTLKFQSVLTHAGTLVIRGRAESQPKILKIKIHVSMLLNPFLLVIYRDLPQMLLTRLSWNLGQNTIWI
jgi:hypothetical protein